MRTEWNGFIGGDWEHEINVRDFIQKNYHPYDGDEAFLAGPTQNTLDLWDEVLELSRKEREAGGVLDMDTKVISTITSHGPGYLDIGPFQHLLEPVEFAGPLSNQAFAVTYKLPQFPLVFVRNVACSQQAML